MIKPYLSSQRWTPFLALGKGTVTQAECVIANDVVDHKQHLHYLATSALLDISPC